MTGGARHVRAHAVVLGGGIAGLWTLDELSRRGIGALLIEPFELGTGQTVWSQGIIHGGLKYTLSGLLTGSAKAIRGMPELWRQCLRGEREPNLSTARVRAEHCHLWRTDDLASRAGMIGARAGLRVAPVPLAPGDRPGVLRACPGTVARIDEQVIDPRSVLAALASHHAARIVMSDGPQGISAQRAERGLRIGVTCRGGAGRIEIAADYLVLCAGAGNAGWRRVLGLNADRAQTRPLHMVLARGELPELNGHCVDGARTRVTITTDRDAQGRTVWQIGGQVAEEGVGLSPTELIERAKSEIEQVLPGLDACGVNLNHAEWSTYRADRSEGRPSALRSGETAHKLVRPEREVVVVEGNVVTVWPTKLALAPLAALEAAGLVERSAQAGEVIALDGLSQMVVAAAPWDQEREWRRIPAG